MTDHPPSPGAGGQPSPPLSPASSGRTPHAEDERPTDIHSVQGNVSAGQRPVSPSVPPVRALCAAALTSWSRGPPRPSHRHLPSTTDEHPSEEIDL
jgi:hypothetical protein